MDDKDSKYVGYMGKKRKVKISSHRSKWKRPFFRSRLRWNDYIKEINFRGVSVVILIGSN